MKYHNITHDDMLNGDGLRVVLWVAGCEHHCPGCQNPETWDEEDGLVYDQVAWQEIEEELKKDYVSGITFSGGDPLHTKNRGQVIAIARRVKELYPNKTVWVYTGYRWEDVKDIPGIEYVDVLVDGRFIQTMADVNYHWAGSTNQRVIDIHRTLVSGSVVLLEDKAEKHSGMFETGCCGG
jgi:anaerobic ribonucleoside-triphosphate reductase activating protein